MRAWWHVLRDAVKQFLDKGLMQRAAALAYFAILSIFPGVIVLVSLLGVLGHEGTVDSALRIVDRLGAEQAVDALQGPVESAVESTRAAGFALVLGSVLALWTASAYMGSFMLAMNDVYETAEARPFWKRRPLQLVITLAVVVTLAVAIVALVLTGPIAEAVGEELGTGDTVLTAWSIVRWPLMFALIASVIALLYRVAPNTGRKRPFRWIVPGSVLATLLWLAASAGFSLYVSNFGSYSNTYGGLAGAIVFLIWLWLSNIAVLFGASFSAELERTSVAARRTDHDELRPLDDAPSPADTAPAADVTHTRPADNPRGERGG